MTPLISKVVDAVPSPVAHTVGIGSGASGLVLWSDISRHLTTIVGLLIALVALAGGLFYAGYWLVKFWREYKLLKEGK